MELYDYELQRWLPGIKHRLIFLFRFETGITNRRSSSASCAPHVILARFDAESI